MITWCKDVIWSLLFCWQLYRFHRQAIKVLSWDIDDAKMWIAHARWGAKDLPDEISDYIYKELDFVEEALA